MSSPLASNDSVEFRCSQCQQLLKVSSSLTGRQVRCPQCSSIQNVPQLAAPPQAAPQSAPQAAPLGSAPSALPSGMPGQAGNPGGMSSAPGSPAAADPGLAPVSAPAPVMTPSSSKEGSDTPTRQLYKKITEEIAKVYVGQDELVMGTLVALFSNGHVLIESVPGLGKTLFVRTLGKVLGCQFGRIQFTADLMPSDITGAPVYNMKSQEFDFRPGPVFTQLLLADEINRSPAKTHAALLEIMQERTVTVDGETHRLNDPFLVMATQNPIESEGTYNLPEAQLDRFMFKLIANYPSAEEEARILTMHGGQDKLDERLKTEVETVTNDQEIAKMVLANSKIRVDPLLVNYINEIVRKTRQWQSFHMGASPRAGIALMQGARTLAAFYGRDFVVPDDVVQIALPTLRHRVGLTAEAEVEGQDVNQLLSDLIRTIEVPRIQ